MPLISINNVQESQRKPSTLEKIAMGVDIASKVLGTVSQGANAYSETFGAKKDLYKSEAEKNKAEAANFMSKSSEPHLGELAKIAAESLSKSGKQITDERDTSPDKHPTYLPGVAMPVWVKDAPVDKKEKYNLEDSMAKDFNALDEVQRFKQTHEAALNSVAVSQKQANKTVSRSDDLALLASFIKMQQPNARFNGENVEGVKAETGTLVGDAVMAFKKIYHSEGGLLDEKDRANLISTIQAQYQATRPLYEQSYGHYSQTADQRSVGKTVNYLAPIKFNTEVAGTPKGPAVHSLGAKPVQPQVQVPQKTDPRDEILNILRGP